MRRFPKPLVLLVVSMALLAGLVLIAVNPFDWFLKRSERFTIDGFLAIEPGMEITEVVDRLGEPIGSAPAETFHDCEGCTFYLFLGNPPEWIVVFREALVAVDADGKVLYRILIEEP